MPNPMDYIGGQHIPGSTHANGLRLRGNVDTQTVPNVEYTLKSSLPIIGRDPSSREPLVIKKGTILTVEDGWSVAPTIDICGVGERPAGVAPKNYVRESYFAQSQGTSQGVAAPLRDCYINMPYIEAVNGVAASLPNGRWLKAGAAGVFVAWDSAADSPELAVGVLESVDTRVDPSGWLRYVSDSMEWPVEAMFPANILKDVTRDGNANAAVVATTGTLSRTIDGSVVTVGITPASCLKASLDNTKYYFANADVSLRKPCYVIVAGVTLDRADEDGHWASGDGYDYRLNTRWGYVEFSSAQATTATVQATYSYEFDYAAGRDWAAGIQGLTDGVVSGMGAGWKAFHDVAGATGVMTIRLF